MFIPISADEFSLCIHVATQRLISAIKSGRQDRMKRIRTWDDSLSAHLSGCVGELAAAKALNIQWSGSVDTFKAVSDLRGEIEVRHRTNPEWDLILRDDDRSDRVYVLTRGMPPNGVEVAGYIQGHAGKKDEYKKDWGKWGEAYFVPASALHPIEGLVNHG